MKTPVVNRRELSHEANGDGRPDRELRESNRHMHEFLALLGHELRSPLDAAQNALRVLEVRGEDVATREWAVALIGRQTQRLCRLVEDLLEGSRIAAGKIQLRRQRVGLAQLMVRAAETVRASVEGCGHHLDVTLPPEGMVLDADPGRLEQVLTNLLNNASKYMEPGGRIWLTGEVTDGEVVLRVRDSGIGIAPEMLPHVFDPYWQVERTLDHAKGGLGIGLALVRKLAEMHEGSVSASSQGLGHGSEFVVRFPAHVGVVDVGHCVQDDCVTVGQIGKGDG